MSIQDGGPAFARPFSKNGEYSDSQQNRSQEGMSLRDYLAAKAAQGLMANPGGPVQKDSQCGWRLVNCTFDDVAEHAYGLADAMLAVRSA